MERKQIKTYKIKFDDIIHELDDEEFWYARELQKLLGYEQWRNFELIIHKAQTSCESAGVMHRTILLKLAKWFLLGVAQNHQLSPGENPDGQGFAGECKKRSKAWASQPDRWTFFLTVNDPRWYTIHWKLIRLSQRGNIMKRCISLLLLLAILLTLTGCSLGPESTPTTTSEEEEQYLRILSCPENKELEPILNDFASEHNARFDFSYAGALDIIRTLNSDEASDYDAVWLSNSIWTSKLDNSSILTYGKSIFISPVVFAIDREEGEKLNLIGRDVTLKEIMQAVTSSGISFAIPNITRTNSGASIYLSILSTLAGNPPVMTISQISQDSVTEELKDFFSHVGRTSGSEDYLLELVENGEYNCMVNTESQVLALNRRLEAAGKDPMYILYPTDGVSIGDAPLYFVNNDSGREGIFLELQRYLLSSTVQEQLLNRGFRANYGGTIDPEYADVFKASYGIQIDRCLSPVKYPSMPVITEALNRYQLLVRKPTAIVFCLDYSGSMIGDGIEQLYSAMDYILDNEKTSADFLQFSEADSVTVLGFSHEIEGWETSTGNKLSTLQSFVRNTSPGGGTDIYLAALQAFEILEEYPDDYIKSVVLMTDGMSNGMYFWEFKSESKECTICPVYSITFGEADTEQLDQLAQETGGRVFDGVEDLTNAFREVRGYN